MSARSRKPSVHNGRTAQDFTTLVEAVRRVHAGDVSVRAS